MKRLVTACCAIASLVVAPLTAFAIEYTTGGHDETTETFAGANWGAAAAATPGTVPAGITGTHLLISEVGWRGLNSPTLADSTEFIEIYNPTTSPVDLSVVYLSDAQLYFKLPVTGLIDLNATASDFAVRFPAGASIAGGGVKVIAVDGGRYKRGTGLDADFMMFNAGGSTTAQQMVDVHTNGGATYPTFGSFTNTAEFTWLFLWNGYDDLVCDLDMVYWGTPTGTNAPQKKLATDCQDGPDANAFAECYFADTGTIGTGLSVPASGAGTRQRVGPENDSVLSQGNGCRPGRPTEGRRATWGQVKAIYR